MWPNARDAYLETRVLAADPVELVGMAYQATLVAVRDARTHLAAGDIAARSRSISKAYDILVELANSLDHQRAPEISKRLAALYDYIQRRLLAANFEQKDAPLAEVLRLLTTLAEGWEGVKRQLQPPAEAAKAWKSPPPDPGAYVSQGWSF